MVIAKAKMIQRDEIFSNEFKKKAEKRRAAVNKYCWNKLLNYYTDYNFKTQHILNAITPAGMYPFCFFENKSGNMNMLAKKAAVDVKKKLLKDGGIVTSEKNTGEQWDAPNGWAPLEWMTIWGLDNCGQEELAKIIAQRWMKLNNDVFMRTGKLMEKYNVVNIHLDAGGGEYPGQDGFGWTNGVLLALIKKYGMPSEN
jgi:alpha,alpha-trehalase